MNAFLLALILAQLPTGTVIYNYPGVVNNVDIMAATVQGYTAVLYVNDIPKILDDLCIRIETVQPINIQCTAVMPDIRNDMTPSGEQRFQVALRTVIFGVMVESGRSLPVTLPRPEAPFNLRFQ